MADQVLDRIQKELDRAEEARNAGNPGMMRVCARRAAGIAITAWLDSNPRRGWGIDALTQLQHLEAEKEIPQDARLAARRLTARVNVDFQHPFQQDPVEDCRLIIRALLGPGS
jgi:hypothetical protein